MSSLAANINQAIADFDSIKTAIEGKGVTVGNAPTSQYGGKIAEIGARQEIYYTADGKQYQKHMTFADNVTSISTNGYKGCTEIVSVDVPGTVKAINNYGFWLCANLSVVTLADGITSIGDQAFRDCKQLTTINLPATLTSIGGNAFSGCTLLTDLTLGDGFNCNLTVSNGKLTADVMVAMFNALADLTEQDAKTLTLGATNLAKLTAEQKQVATNKNWNLA